MNCTSIRERNTAIDNIVHVSESNTTSTKTDSTLPVLANTAATRLSDVTKVRSNKSQLYGQVAGLYHQLLRLDWKVYFMIIVLALLTFMTLAFRHQIILVYELQASIKLLINQQHKLEIELRKYQQCKS